MSKRQAVKIVGSGMVGQLLVGVALVPSRDGGGGMALLGVAGGLLLACSIAAIPLLSRANRKILAAV